MEVVTHWLQRGTKALPEKERTLLEQAVHSSTVLSTIDAMRQDLSAVWDRTTVSVELMAQQLEDWCRRAEESGIDALREFSRTLRSYDSVHSSSIRASRSV